MSESVQAFESAAGEARARAAIELANQVIPRRCSTVEVHSAMRLAATEAGWKLALINVGEPLSMELPGAGDALARRNVEISGSASFAGLSTLVRALAAHGYPARVVSLTLTRERSDSSKFDTHAILVLFHSIPPLDLAIEPTSGDSPEN